MQELIEQAKAGKAPKSVMSHREFVRAMKSELPTDFKYEKCSEDAKNRWLSIVNKNKSKS